MIWSDPIDSDKHYWHRYSGFYRRHLETLSPVSSILEYGVLRGASIRWLHELFPAATIVGVDIMPIQPDWPTGPGIIYRVADQGNRSGIAHLLRDLGRRFDLVIEDGSHFPRHQVNCLAETMPWVRPGGIYILEDLQTSMTQHALSQQDCVPGAANSLHLVLFIEHLRATGKMLRAADMERLATPGLFSHADVQALVDMIGEVDLYHRATLPLRCYACGGDDFDPVALTCLCGVSIDILGADSLTTILRRSDAENQSAY